MNLDNVIVILGHNLLDNPNKNIKRVISGINLYNDLINSNQSTIVILSGGNPSGIDQSEAMYMLNIIVNNFTNHRSILQNVYLENNSKTTIQNAIFTKELLNNPFLKNKYNRIIIVTTEEHINRAYRIFKYYFPGENIVKCTAN